MESVETSDMMRKNESWADPELCNICLSLKNHLFYEARTARHWMHTKCWGNVKKWQNLSLRDVLQIEWRFYSCLITYLEAAKLPLLRAWLRQLLCTLHEQDWWCSDPRQPIPVSQEIIHYVDRWVEFDMMFTSNSDCAAPGKCQPVSVL